LAFLHIWYAVFTFIGVHFYIHFRILSQVNTDFVAVTFTGLATQLQNLRPTVLSKL